MICGRAAALQASAADCVDQSYHPPSGLIVTLLPEHYLKKKRSVCPEEARIVLSADESPERIPCSGV